MFVNKKLLERLGEMQKERVALSGKELALVLQRKSSGTPYDLAQSSQIRLALREAKYVPVRLAPAVKALVKRAEEGKSTARRGGVRGKGPGTGTLFYVPEDIADIVAKIHPRLLKGQAHLGPEIEIILKAEKQLANKKGNMLLISTTNRGRSLLEETGIARYVHRSSAGIILEIVNKERLLRCAKAIKEICGLE